MSVPLYPNQCPTCGAEPNKPCRTLKTKRVTDTHLARIDARYSAKTKET